MYVEFTQSPTGKYNLAYSPGECAELDNELALKLIQDNYAKRAIAPAENEPEGDPPGGENEPEGDGEKQDRKDKKLKETR